jgi:hypothetical protein
MDKKRFESKLSEFKEAYDTVAAALPHLSSDKKADVALRLLYVAKVEKESGSGEATASSKPNVEEEKGEDWRSRQMSDAQKSILRKMHIIFNDRMTRGQASDLITVAKNKGK